MLLAVYELSIRVACVLLSHQIRRFYYYYYSWLAARLARIEQFVRDIMIVSPAVEKVRPMRLGGSFTVCVCVCVCVFVY